MEPVGYDVICANTGLEGLSLFVEKSVDLVIFDLVMPDMDGLEICNRLRQLSDVPIIILSGNDDVGEKARLMEVGADTYITKPYVPTELLVRIKALLHRPSLVSKKLPYPGFLKNL